MPWRAFCPDNIPARVEVQSFQHLLQFLKKDDLFNWLINVQILHNTFVAQGQTLFLLATGQTDALTSNLYSTLPFDGALCGSNALQIISRAVMCDQPVMSAAAETKKETAILRLVACHWGWKGKKKGGIFLLPPALYLHFSFPHAWSERCSLTKRQWHASARSHVQHQTALLMPRTLSSTSEVGLSWAIFCKQESTKLRK